MNQVFPWAQPGKVLSIGGGYTDIVRWGVQELTRERGGPLGGAAGCMARFRHAIAACACAAAHTCQPLAAGGLFKQYKI